MSYLTADDLAQKARDSYDEWVDPDTLDRYRSEAGRDLEALSGLLDDLTGSGSTARAYADLADAFDGWGGHLIHEDEMEHEARRLAEGVGAIEDADRWPATCIDWERAAAELASDYTCVDYDGESYYTRD